MLETLRKKSRKSLTIVAAVSLVIAVLLLVFTKCAIIEVVTGPKELDVTADPTLLEGHYVTMDVEYLLTDFVEHTTTTTRKYSTSKTTTVDGYSYIALQPVVNDDNVSSTWYFYGIYMRKGDAERLNQMMEDTWNYIEDDTGSVAPPEPMTLKGTWVKMDSDVQRYCESTMAEMGVVEGEYDIVRYYVLNTDKIGGQNTALFWVMTAGAGLCLIWFVINVAHMFGNAYLSKVNAYLQKESTVSMADLDADFSQAHLLINKNFWLGRKWTIYMQGYKVRILDNRNLIWGYYYRRTGRNSVSELRLFDTKKTQYGISMSEQCAHEALGYYSAEQPHMITGYSDELEKMYRKNFQDFLKLRYDQQQEISQE